MEGGRWFRSRATSSRSRSGAKMTGVTIKICRRLLTMPPMTGAAKGLISRLFGNNLFFPHPLLITPVG